jgi:dihydrofolate reductase
VCDAVAKLEIRGGGELAKSLFEADLIDEIGFNVHPVLLGSGIPYSIR